MYSTRGGGNLMVWRREASQQLQLEGSAPVETFSWLRETARKLSSSRTKNETIINGAISLRAVEVTCASTAGIHVCGVAMYV
jgi:hypothetical protein